MGSELGGASTVPYQITGLRWMEASATGTGVAYYGMTTHSSLTHSLTVPLLRTESLPLQA